MACYSFQRALYCSANNFLVSRRASNKLISFIKPRRSYSSDVLFKKGFCRVSSNLNCNRCKVAQLVSSHSISTSAVNAIPGQDAVLESADCRDGLANPNLANGRVMLIDGTSVIYRAYYKLLAKLHHGRLSDADGNGDWVLTIFSALSLIIDVLEFIPSHVAVVFDHNGRREIPCVFLSV